MIESTRLRPKMGHFFYVLGAGKVGTFCAHPFNTVGLGNRKILGTDDSATVGCAVCVVWGLERTFWRLRQKMDNELGCASWQEKARHNNCRVPIVTL